MSQFEEKLKSIPPNPGVYIMKDADDKVLYVGKAVSLSNRVKSYFQSSTKPHALTPNMIPYVCDIDYIITDNEIEALILENNLIKKYKPKYNIKLKDDKRYPYLKITSEDFPRIAMTRNIERDGSKYFGPYVHAKATRQTIKEITKAFPIRSCNLDLSDGKLNHRPCLNYHIGRCLAPCAGLASKEECQEVAKNVCSFLRGNGEQVIKNLTEKMMNASANLDFERAAQIRDRINSIQQILEKQKISSTEGEDQDIIGFYQKDDDVCVVLLMVRGGKMQDQEHFFLSGTEGSSPVEILTAFIEQYYHEASFVPKMIILPNEVEMISSLEKWLSEKRGSAVTLHVPQKGKKLDMVEMAQKNAKSILEREKTLTVYKKDDNPALIGLRELLSLPRQPSRIDCFDISNLGGNLAVGSMVVFQDGMPNKSEYRRYRIKTVQGQDDFAMIKEVITRRIKSALDGETPLPDLMIVDGGKGQLSSALEALKSANLDDKQPIIGLAKKFEHIFIPGRSEPLILDDHSPILHLLQRIRDEAHRFAITYHKKLREKSLTESILDYIPNIGPRRKQLLIQHFGSVERIRSATIDELRSVNGITQKIAEDIRKYIGVEMANDNG